jgi:lipopolysaccharide export LptBFGC system permease protein LptF
MPLEELLRALSTMPEGPEASAARTEVSKRFSFSLACVAFALIAVPFGIVAQRRETSIGFGLSILIGFVYFLFIPLADTFRNNPAARPELLIWLPNVIFIGLGLFLFARMARR